MIEGGVSTRSPEGQEGEPFGDLTIFTTTFYRDDDMSRLRAELALGTFANASQLGINIIVVDGGSRQDFLDELKGFENVTIVKENPSWKMGESIREGLRRAMGKHQTAFYLWTEPEKTNLVTEGCLGPVIAPLRMGEADIVVPKRKEEGMQGLPKIQRWFEERANGRATRIMHKISLDETNEIRKGKDGEIDFWFGPKLFNQKGAGFFLDYRAKGLDRWDAHIVPVVMAYRAGLIVASVEVDYTYDERQKTAEESNRVIKQKRLDQYKGILLELDDPFWIKNPSSIRL